MKRKAEELAGEEAKEQEFNHGSQWIRGKMIGKGGFGSVYIATLKKSKSRLSWLPPVMAVKSAEYSVSDTLQKEKQVLDNLRDCPHVIQCFGEEITHSQNGQMVFNLLLEFASGGTLAEEVKKAAGKGLPESDVKRYTFSILRGLDHVHRQGFVHCDLKPENIFLVQKSDSAYWAKIGDFGLAERIRSSRKREMHPCLKGSVMYMAPEVVISHKHDAGSDIWALGCVVLEMLTGKSPWQNPNTSSADLLGLISNPKKSPTIPRAISKEGKDFLKGCFAKNSAFRLTAEMLLRHPFMAGLDEGTDSETELESSMAENDENKNGDEDDDEEEDEDEDEHQVSDCYSMFEEAVSSYSSLESEDSRRSEAPGNENAPENVKLASPKKESAEAAQTFPSPKFA